MVKNAFSLLHLKHRLLVHFCHKGLLGVLRADFQMDTPFFRVKFSVFADFLHYSNFEAENRLLTLDHLWRSLEAFPLKIDTNFNSNA
jgi:hypothetical protein